MRTQIFDLLNNVLCLTMEDKLDATELIGARNDCLEIFMSFNEEARAAYSICLLQRERK